MSTSNAFSDAGQKSESTPEISPQILQTIERAQVLLLRNGFTQRHNNSIYTNRDGDGVYMCQDGQMYVYMSDKNYVMSAADYLKHHKLLPPEERRSTVRNIANFITRYL